MHHRGLSLIEVLIVLCLVTVLAVVSLPMLTHANDQARSTACQANLLTIGQLVQNYHNDHGRLPVLMNRDNVTLDVPTIDQLFADPLRGSAVLHCPADDRALCERSGTSYRWYTVWNDQPMATPGAPSIMPLLADKAPFHHDQPDAYNALFVKPDAEADGRVGFSVSPIALPQ